MDTAAPPPVADSDAVLERQARELEQRRMVRGLLVLGAAVLAASVMRAGLHRVFYAGWWRQW